MQATFIGNCQALEMCRLWRQFVGEATYVASYTEGTEAGRTAIREADVVAVQVTTWDMKLGAVETAAPVRLFPHISAMWLWPHGGEAHPHNPTPAHYPEGPYPDTLGDRYLNRLILAGVDPEEAVEQYLAEDLGPTAERLMEWTLHQQRKRDDLADIPVAQFVARGFRAAPLFRTSDHPAASVMTFAAETLFSRMGASRDAVACMMASATSGFPETQQPVHPSIGRHFGLTWWSADMLYKFWPEGRYTFREWAERYMRCQWSPCLREAIEILNGGGDAAKAHDLVMVALDQAPRSAVARMLASTYLAGRGGQGIQTAATLATEAAALAPDNGGFGSIAANLRRMAEATQSPSSACLAQASI